MYVDWEYYKIFYYVAKYQNFTKAARVLGSNQPNITHAMNRLESQLNCVLFIRSNRGVTLTPEGELLYSRIASAAVQIQDAEEELSASATLEHGAISISATETALNIYLSEKLRAFHTEYPGIRLRISNHSTPQAVQAVKNGEVYEPTFAECLFGGTGVWPEGKGYADWQKAKLPRMRLGVPDGSALAAEIDAILKEGTER